MDKFPLQDELIVGVIRFANMEIHDPRAVAAIFRDWLTGESPNLRTCRQIQSTVRKWLATMDTDSAVNTYLPKDGIELGGLLGARSITRDGVNRFEVTMQWHLKKASLQAVCGLAVAQIRQAGWQDRVKQCERDECGNYFIDRKGRKRKYCLANDCEKARGAARTAKSREKE